MSNTLIIDSLNTLFSMSNTAVIGAQEQFVAFMNPAAQELFRGNRTNHKLTELLPAHITEATATEFVTSATIEKRHVIISVTSFGAFRLFSFVPQDENALRAGAQFAPFLASLNAFRTLTTYFSDYAMQLSDVRFRRNAAELTQFYYRLLRFTLNASTASGLYDGTLAFMPQLCDLGKECRTLLDNIQPITDANGIVLEVSIPDEPINCALDTALIQRMLLNIIANCTERCKHGDRIRFTVTQEGDHADITIRDDGVRIPPEKLGTIFIPLRVTGVDFSDLSSNSFGLTVALGIAEKHDGTILLESNEWGGTTFHVVLSTVLPETNLFRAPLGQVRFWLIAVTKKALFYRRVSVCFAALFVFIIIRLKSQYFLCQLAFVSIGISIMCDQINFFSCQINSVCTVNNHSCEIRTGSFIDKTIF